MSLVPELKVTDLDVSRQFYVDGLGFAVVFERPEDRFVYLRYDGAELMLEQIPNDDRVAVGALTHPFGRGINLQIECADVDELTARIEGVGLRLFLPVEVRWYRRDGIEVGQRQTWIQDPDGYLLRFFSPLGTRG